MQRCQKLEVLLMEGIEGADPLAHPDTRKQAALYLRELERLQRLQIVQDVHFGDENRVGALHDLQFDQQFAKRNPTQYPTVGRNSPWPCGSGKKYKRCCGVDAPPILYAA